MLPKLKQDNYHAMNVCTALRSSNSIPGVAAVIFTLAGNLVKSEVRIRLAGNDEDHDPAHPHRHQREKRGGGG